MAMPIETLVAGSKCVGKIVSLRIQLIYPRREGREGASSAREAPN